MSKNKITPEQFMEFFRDDECLNELSVEDRTEVWETVLPGSSDITATMLRRFLRDYDRDDIEVIDRNHARAIVWDIEDVMSCANNDELGDGEARIISEKEAKYILEQVMENHDAGQGITWDDFSWAIQEYVDERDGKIPPEDLK